MPAHTPASTYRVAAAGEDRFETMKETIQAERVSVAAKLLRACRVSWVRHGERGESGNQNARADNKQEADIHARHPQRELHPLLGRHDRTGVDDLAPGVGRRFGRLHRRERRVVRLVGRNLVWVKHCRSVWVCVCVCVGAGRAG